MNNYLVIDTTKFNSYISLAKGDKLQTVILDMQNKVSENLLPAIEKLLIANDITINDIDCFGVVIGPGSFTGIRVGMATIKAFVTALGTKLVAFNAFECLAENVGEGMIVEKSTNTTMYSAEVKNGVISAVSVLDIAVVAESSKLEKCYCVAGEPIDETINVMRLQNYGEQIVKYAIKKAQNGEFVDANIVEPYYVQLSQAEVQLLNKEKKNV